jgi:hypothetical protein
MAAKKIQTISKIINTADALAERHAVYTEQFVTRANEELYKLLSDMLALTVEIQASPLCADIVKQMRNDLRSKYQIRTQSNSPVASIVVRYVSRTGRKMAHVYGRVIQIAVDSEISAEKLPQFIRDNGGIESIRKKAATAAENESSRARFEKTRNKLVAAIDPRNLPSLGTVQFADGRKVLNSNGRTEYRLLLCKSGDGLDVPQIVGVLAPNKEIEDTALRDYIICCGIASMSETESFYSLCKEVGYDMDDVLRWAKENGMPTATEAGERCKKIGLKVRAKTPESSNQGDALKLAA